MISPALPHLFVDGDLSLSSRLATKIYTSVIPLTFQTCVTISFANKTQRAAVTTSEEQYTTHASHQDKHGTSEHEDGHVCKGKDLINTKVVSFSKCL